METKSIGSRLSFVLIKKKKKKMKAAWVTEYSTKAFSIKYYFYSATGDQNLFAKNSSASFSKQFLRCAFSLTKNAFKSPI